MTTKTFVVALEYGGVMEHPSIIYMEHQYIEATSSEEAVAIYNLTNDCSYYKGKCLGEVKDGKVELPVTKLTSSTAIV